jgi:peptidoglycan/LPS O-acetylase OafA/YrhL
VLVFHAEVVTTLTHPDSGFATFFNLGFTGVDFFFLLSGFLMVWVHRRDFDHPQRLRTYLAKRVARIYPIYWFLCIFLVPLTLHFPALRQNQAIDPAALIASIFLLPHPGNRLLGVTWTLEYELLFYLVFTLFFFSRRLGQTVFVLWLVAILAVAVFGPIPQIPTGAPQFSTPVGWLCGFFLNLHLVEFFTGMLIAHLLQSGFLLRRPILVLNLSAAVGIALQIVAFHLGSHALSIEQGHRLVTLVAGTLAALILLSLVQWDLNRSASSRPIPRLLTFLGAASYSIYLTHFLVISFARVAFSHSPRLAATPVWLQFSAILLIAPIPGILLHLWVERPLLTFTTRLLSPRQPSPV